STRRRHTRSDRDWSSDVCSSDLNSFGNVSVTTTLAACEGPLFVTVSKYSSDSPAETGVEPTGAFVIARSAFPGAGGFGDGPGPRSEERRVGEECRQRRGGGCEKK